MNRLIAGIAALVGCLLGFAEAARADDNDAPAGSPANSFKLSSCQPGTWSIDGIVRQDFNDGGISPFTCPTDPSPVNPEAGRHLVEAVGARASVTFDQLAHTTAVAIDGLGAMVIRYYGADLGLALGPYVQGNGTDQFASANSGSQTTETVTAGGFAQLVFTNDFGIHGEDYFRIRAGEVNGGIGSSAVIGSTTVIGEWLPVFDVGNHRIGIEDYSPDGDNTSIRYSFAPELMVQYDQLDYGPNKYLLFSTNNQAFRIGPQVVLKLWNDKDKVPVDIVDPIRWILQQTSVSITYHASWDTYSGRAYSWVQPALTVNLNPDDHFAISASYGYGNSETTANKTSQIKLGLAAKY